MFACRQVILLTVSCKGIDVFFCIRISNSLPLNDFTYTMLLNTKCSKKVPEELEMFKAVRSTGKPI